MIAVQQMLSKSKDGVWFSRAELVGMSIEVLDSLELRNNSDEQDTERVSYYATFKGNHATKMQLHVRNGAPTLS